ncbi:MAG TPA: ankyrin repeat domain-containing protein, partial [Pseudodesulfovibrio sp.]|nr:ankyrin repeat domain-containing protein [Pseudodesulfovibrio sp.]
MSIKLLPAFLAAVLLLFPFQAGTCQARAAVESKAPAKTLDANGFVKAAKKGEKGVVTTALKNGQDPNVKDTDGNTALIEAAKEGRLEMAALLIAHGASLNEGDAKFGGTPLIWAALNGRTEMVKLLLDKGADLESRERLNGLTALLAAAVKGNTETVRFLLNKGAPVQTKDSEGRTALMWAANGGRTATVKLLLDRGATLEATEEDKGMNAL